MTDWLEQRLAEANAVLERLIAAPKMPFDGSLRSRLPEDQGLYAIHVKNALPGEVLRAGRTKTAGAGLRQRVYQNHLMGNQQGNLRSQLVKSGMCASLIEAKLWVRQNCLVQFLVVEDESTRAWAEHFILAILRPRFGD